MHTSTSRSTRHRQLRCRAAMMEDPAARPGRGEHPESLDFRRAMRKVEAEFGEQDWWFTVWGRTTWPPRHRHSREWCCSGRDLARLRRPGRRFQPARPHQVHHHHAGLGMSGQFSRPASRPASSPSSWPNTGWSSRRRACTRSSSCSPSASQGRWNTLLTALQQFKDDYDRNAPMWRMLPEFCAAHPRYERMG